MQHSWYKEKKSFLFILFSASQNSGLGNAFLPMRHYDVALRFWMFLFPPFPVIPWSSRPDFSSNALASSRQRYSRKFPFFPYTSLHFPCPIILDAFLLCVEWEGVLLYLLFSQTLKYLYQAGIGIIQGILSLSNILVTNGINDRCGDTTTKN